MPERSPTTVVAWLIAAVLGTIAALRLLDGARPSGAPPVRVEGGPPAGSAAVRRGSGVYVHVVGAVRRPGLYELGPADRVARALERAGGPVGGADLASINLAARLEDGQQVVVPRARHGPASALAGPSPAVKPSLAQATVAQLEELDGIGPTLARRIVEYRREQGGLASIGELAEVDGIGPKRLESLREALSP